MNSAARSSKVNDHIQRELQRKFDEAAAKASKLQKSLDGEIDIENGFFTASIYDLYDAMGPPCGSNTQTKRGLENAIKAVEREYERQMGSLRTDGVLRYSVYAELPSTDIALPPRLWYDLTGQTLTSITKGRKSK